MRLTPVIHITAALLLAGCDGAPDQGTADSADVGAPEYPHARRAAQTDVVHGVEVSDPYRWMEQRGTDELMAWVRAQDELRESYVSQPEMRATLVRRITDIGEFKTQSLPITRAERYFYTTSPVGLNHSLWNARRGVSGPEELVFDPSSAFDVETLSVGGYTPSPTGTYSALRINQNGERIGYGHIIDNSTGKLLPDRVEGLYSPTFIWTEDESGFFYASYGGTEALIAGSETPRARIYYHVIGTDTVDDVLVYDRPDAPGLRWGMNLSDDFSMLIINEYTSDGNRLLYKRVSDLGAPATQFMPATGQAAYVGMVGSVVLLRTDIGAPNVRLIGIDLNAPLPTSGDDWVEIVPEYEEPMQNIYRAKDYIVGLYRRDVRPFIRVHNLEGKLLYDEPTAQTASAFGLTVTPQSNEIFYALQSLFNPGTGYRLDLVSRETNIFFKPAVNHNIDDFETTQVFYSSDDGTRVPMFLVHKKGIKPTGKNPTFIYAFGSGSFVANPWFQPYLVAWLEMGGIYALPGVRGGGEYGEAWMKAGAGANKPTTIDDYQAAVKWLVANNYSSADRIVGHGSSASGFLPLAIANRDPNLIGAVQTAFPLTDLIRYSAMRILVDWTNSGYGDASDPAIFNVLKTYSPYHNITDGACYPPMQLTIPSKDGINPAHGYKYLAALQRAQGCDNPILMKVVWGVDHRWGSTAQQSIESHADELNFLAKVFDIEMPAGW